VATNDRYDEQTQDRRGNRQHAPDGRARADGPPTCADADTDADADAEHGGGGFIEQRRYVPE
jgi:hypothetical protein